MLNALTVDVEDYFHVEAFASQIRVEQWDSFTPRVERNVHRILELFARRNVRGTFFVLGWVAQKFPRLVSEIVSGGHEVGSHGYLHRRLHLLTPEEFRKDIRDSISILGDQAQQPVHAYRAPSFSIVPATSWAFDVLSDEGITLDSSVFPVKHDLYGYPEAERFPHWRHLENGRRIFEFPPSTIQLSEQKIGMAGGGYLRLVPYGITHWAIRNLNNVQRQPAMVYFHPWEIDPDQPQIRAARKSILRHYTNLSTMQEKIERLLQDFQFGSISDVCRFHNAYLAADPLPVEAARPLVAAAGASGQH